MNALYCWTYIFPLLTGIIYDDENYEFKCIKPPFFVDPSGLKWYKARAV
ncbi:hypothetical protein GPAL_2800 [Glaciecola pallidula DSM 14239 = ACAM 615]|uniref:Uncharacterized protein n=1 Tax=Brumicola pallidula DSM 14239 = ACAM 615 TaxID=1121922 RepID=K6Z0A9_9ALTE|nr:hypothetical protein GPAL_2800 [Glaciecola pallidula DSM 14239 = ACAM 615]